MPKIKAVGLQRRTIGIMNDFFDNIDMLNDKNLSSYQMNLSIRVKKFFEDMNQLGEQEFAEFLKKHQFENRDLAQQQKYNDAFNCLVALIVNEYAESDLLRYFLPKKYSIEAKPTSESSSLRIVYWARLLGYWVRKLFNTQRFEMVNAETDNESLGSAIKVIKQDLRESNYFDLLQNAIFQENLGVVVGKFVENRNIANVEQVENETSSNGDISPAADDSSESFRRRGFNFDTSSSTSTSQLVTKLVLPPSPPPPPPAPTGTVNPVSASPGPSTSAVKTTKAPVRSALGNNDTDALFNAIKKGVSLKRIEEREKLQNKPNLKNSPDMEEVLKKALAIRRDAIEGNPKKTQEEGNDEDWGDGPKTIGSETTEQFIAIPSKAQSQTIANTYGGFFSKPPRSKADEKYEKILSDRSSLTL